MHINLPMMFGSVASWRASVLDLNSKTVRQIGDGLRPVASPDVEPGSPGSRLLQRGDNEFVLWDPETDELKPLLGPAAGPKRSN